MAKAIIFDWRRTLFDDDSGYEFPEAEGILQSCKSKGLRLATVSLVSKENEEKRRKEIENSKLRKYFDMALVTSVDKAPLFEEVRKTFSFSKNEICIIGDRIKDEIQIGIKNGYFTIWLRKGKFANDAPTKKTENPNHIILKLNELLEFL